jgi:hypothetical protein
VRLVQLRSVGGARQVARVGEDGNRLAILGGATTVRELALEAARAGRGLTGMVAGLAVAGEDDLSVALRDRRVLVPLDHPDPAHCWVTGTGLTHLGSAQARDSMHVAEKADEAKLTDSMRMFRLGLEGGKPAGGGIGVQPEWFYKGDGSTLAAPETPLVMPGFALDGGEEAELAILYVIDDEGRPRRIGAALGNEFSDHVLERQNYLYLAHSKLRASSFGPELRLGDPPRDLQGTVRVRRGGEAVFEAAFVSGEDNMSHSLANLEHHHFKYPLFRRPGDVHVHYLGTATLSFAAGVRTLPGDVFEIEADGMGAPLRNPLARAEDEGMLRVLPL